MSENEKKEEKSKFLERFYVSHQQVYQGYMNCYKDLMVASPDLDSAVPCSNQEIEIGIYQLVRVAKFKKTAVEQVILTEMPKNE